MTTVSKSKEKHKHVRIKKQQKKHCAYLLILSVYMMMFMSYLPVLEEIQQLEARKKKMLRLLNNAKQGRGNLGQSILKNTVTKCSIDSFV